MCVLVFRHLVTVCAFTINARKKSPWQKTTYLKYPSVDLTQLKLNQGLLRLAISNYQYTGSYLIVTLNSSRGFIMVTVKLQI